MLMSKFTIRNSDGHLHIVRHAFSSLTNKESVFSMKTPHTVHWAASSFFLAAGRPYKYRTNALLSVGRRTDCLSHRTFVAAGWLGQGR